MIGARLTARASEFKFAEQLLLYVPRQVPDEWFIDWEPIAAAARLKSSDYSIQ
jgi:hypothetical protein